MVKRDEQVYMEVERKGFQTPALVEKVYTSMPE